LYRLAYFLLLNRGNQ